MFLRPLSLLIHYDLFGGLGQVVVRLQWSFRELRLLTLALSQSEQLSIGVQLALFRGLGIHLLQVFLLLALAEERVHLLGNGVLFDVQLALLLLLLEVIGLILREALGLLLGKKGEFVFVLRPREMLRQVEESLSDLDCLQQLRVRELEGLPLEDPENGKFQNFLTVRSLQEVHVQHLQNRLFQARRVKIVERVDLAPLDLFIELVHRVRLERGLLHAHFVDHAAETPNVRFNRIRLVPPDLRRGVIGSPSLGVGEEILDYLGDVHVPQLHIRSRDEDIGRFEVSVDDAFGMEFVESAGQLEEVANDRGLGESFLQFLHFLYFLSHVSLFGILHDETEVLVLRVDEGLSVANDEGVLDGGEDSNFVEGVFELFLFEH